MTVDPDTDFIAWRDSIAGFNPSRWWRPILCTHQTGEIAGSEMLGLVFEHDENGETYWAPRIKGLNEARNLTEPPLLQLTRLNEHEKLAVRQRTSPGGNSVWFGRGSLNAICPSGCEVRIAREAWETILANTRRLSPPCIDVSLYSGTSPNR